MLDELIVTNLGLIGHTRLEPGPGLIVVTGETGTGKTLLLGALRLLLGAPGRRDLVGPGGDEATVQARFIVDGEEIAVARRIGEGKSRAYVDGLVAPVKALEERTAGLVDLVAQHDHLRLTRPAEVRSMLDGVLDDAGNEARAAYEAAWRRLSEVTERKRRLGGDRRTLERELETCRHQAGEIAAAGFAPGDDVELGRTASRLRNASSILEMLRTAADGLGEEGAEAPLDSAVSALERVAEMDPELKTLADQAIDVSSLLGELRTEVAAVSGTVEAEPARLEEVEERLAVLSGLRRKYGDGLDEVLAFGKRARSRAEELEALLTEADDIETAVAEAQDSVDRAGATLTTQRRHAGERVTSAAVGHLQELGFEHPVVRFDVDEAAAGPTGTDRVELRFASDAALEPGPVGRASGGELSRLVLALRLASGADEAATAAFDEIDAGVGGAVALALGRKLAGLARRGQVLAVTHLPQVAAYADRHYVVRRTGTETTVVAVDGDDRIEELSRMLAGMPESDRGRRHAAELVAMATGDKAKPGEDG